MKISNILIIMILLSLKISYAQTDCGDEITALYYSDDFPHGRVAVHGCHGHIRRLGINNLDTTTSNLIKPQTQIKINSKIS